ncbi:MAG: [protein-PII] uridylyltransferase [Nitrospirae bacterium]|nr:[protein-PII] uridylyltransferase [Nitrospirota bacterium]
MGSEVLKLEIFVDELKELFYRGLGGREMVRTYSNIIDRYIRSIFNRNQESLAIVALGGYGRQEMAPYSDVDLMFLYRDKLAADAEKDAKNLLYNLWDSGFQVGHSFRSIKDCMRIAAKDITTKTSFLEARFLTGNIDIYKDFRAEIDKILSRKPQIFLTEKLREMFSRHRNYGSSPYLLEPHVKEGEGGLRDVHTAMWLARVVLKLEGSVRPGIEGLNTVLSEKNYARLLNAFDFLLRVRVGLQLESKRKNDVLSFLYQEALAPVFGFKDAEDFSAPERFMRYYYIKAREIKEISFRVFEICGSRFIKRPKRPVMRKISDAFILSDGYIVTAHFDKNFFTEEPLRLMEAFYLSQKYRTALSPLLKEAIGESLHLVDEAFRESKKASEFFIEILKGHRVYETLKEMHDSGFLGNYIPEFAMLNALVIFDVYHKYTVDEHTLFAIKTLQALEANVIERLTFVADVYKALKRPHNLFLALLLHDIGKAMGRGHESAGLIKVRNILERLSIEGFDKEEVTFLVTNHLLMSQIAQKREAEDPNVVSYFARIVGDEEKLNALFLLSYADISAVRPGFWSDWKAFLLEDLYLRTSMYLRGEERDRYRAVYNLLPKYPSITEEDVSSHFKNMSERYLNSTPPETVIKDIKVVDSIRKDSFFFFHSKRKETGSTELTIGTWDSPGLFSRITGVISSKGLNILRGQVFTGYDGIVINRMQISNWDEIYWDGLPSRLKEDLRGALLEAREIRPVRAGGEVTYNKFSGVSVRTPVKIELDNEISSEFTVLELTCPDRVGLLYDISALLFSKDIGIVSAKINTDAEVAMDVFYINSQGRKVSGYDGFELMGVLWELLKG